MRKTLTVLFLFAATGLSACAASTQQSHETSTGNTNSKSMKLQIKIDTATFTATLADNATAKAFKEMLPLRINMIDLNKNEKYFDLQGSLPAAASRPGTIQAGDIMLFGSRTLVLFYKTFPTSYSYTRIGRIDNATGLETAAGSGNAIIVFEQLK